MCRRKNKIAADQIAGTYDDALSENKDDHLLIGDAFPPLVRLTLCTTKFVDRIRDFSELNCSTDKLKPLNWLTS